MSSRLRDVPCKVVKSRSFHYHELASLITPYNGYIRLFPELGDSLVFLASEVGWHLGQFP